jgi:CMP-N,N'-diacetyllegionaminic acid synthase
MIKSRALVVVIPARGGSKGIPGKNLYKVAGVSLVERAIQIGKACQRVDKVMVSTDHPETHIIAQQHDSATPSLRPEKLATDSARTVDVIADLVDENVIDSDDCVLLLQPSSPLRTKDHIEAVCDLMEAQWDQADAVVSVCEIDGPTPYKAQTVEDGYLQSLLGQDSTVPRQSLPKTYIPNGAFYLVKVSALLEENTFIPSRSIPYMMSSVESLNLDSPMDLLILEAVIDKGMVEFGENGDIQATVSES